MVWKIKKIGNEYLIGRISKTSYGSEEFVLPLGRTYKFKNKKVAEKALLKFNK